MGSSAVFGQKPATTSLPAGEVVGAVGGTTVETKASALPNAQRQQKFVVLGQKIQNKANKIPTTTCILLSSFNRWHCHDFRSYEYFFYYVHTQKLCIFIWNLINEIDYFSGHFMERFLQLFTFYRFIC